MAIEKEIDANEEVADLAEAILKVADAGERLLSSRLTKRAVKILLRDLIGSSVGLSEIEAVLNALPRLKEYVKK